LPLALLLTLLNCDSRAAPGADGGTAPDLAAPPRGDAIVHSGDIIPGWQDQARPPGTGLRDAGLPALDTGPLPPNTCKAGQRRWCSNLVYSGYGLVECDPATGKWKTVMYNGKMMLDCHGSAAGKVPATNCACYHFFYNPACCETPDCILPAGTSGQVCPSSPGKLCDYCNPLEPTCEPGAKCMVTNSSETFCGKSCEDAPCPAGYNCMTVKLKAGGSTKQCVPNDLSCFY
jgi:hypothetical protein